MLHAVRLGLGLLGGWAIACNAVVVDDAEDGVGGEGGGVAVSVASTARASAATTGVSTVVATAATTVSQGSVSAAESSSTGMLDECEAFSFVHVVGVELVDAGGDGTFVAGEAGMLNVRWRNDGPQDFNMYPGVRVTSMVTDPPTSESIHFAIFAGMENESSFPFLVVPDAPSGAGTIVVEIVTLHECAITETAIVDLTVVD